MFKSLAICYLQAKNVVVTAASSKKKKLAYRPLALIKATLNYSSCIIVCFVVFLQTVVIQGAKVIKANQLASNGIIHVVDSVLKPAEESTLNYLESSAKYSIITELAKWLKPDLNCTTLFAPTDEAFGTWPPGRLETLKNEKSCANVSK